MKWSVDDFVAYLKTPPTSELDAFKRQNTVYAVFILLEALSVGEAMFREGVLTIDDVQYDCKTHLPVTAVTTYGFGAIQGEAYDETVGRGVVGLLEGIYLLRAQETVETLEDTFAEICSTHLDWNYYGAFVGNDAAMPTEWAARGAALFVPPVAAEVVQEPAPATKPPRFFARGQTRRMHGKRALSPIRRTRATATTRRRKHTNTP